MRRALFTYWLSLLFVTVSNGTDLPDWISNPLRIPASERLVCTRIRSICGTRLLPPDIEREFTCTRRPSSELILTCHSVTVYARSQCVFSLPLPIRPSKASNLPRSSLPSETLFNLAGKQLIPSIYMQIQSRQTHTYVAFRQERKFIAKYITRKRTHL